MNTLLRHLAALVVGLLPLLPAAAQTVDPTQLPPVDSVFIPKASAPSRDRIEVTWTIAKGYYLYRHRISVQPLGGFEAGALQLPDGDKHHDEFFGDVQTYRGSVTAVLQGKASGDAVTLRIKYQGCADAGVCYPPQTRTISVALPPASDAGGDSGFAAFGKSLAGNAQNSGGLIGNQAATPLPPEQAFRIEAIADGGSKLLLRMTPAKGYYLYRDKLKLKLSGDSGIHLGTPQLPKATQHHDDHFGDVAVYFGETMVSVPLQRSHDRAANVVLDAEWQGCQDGGLCYPVMRNRFNLALPAGASTQQTKAVASAPAQTAITAAAATAAVAASGAATPNDIAPAAASSTATPTATAPASTTPDPVAPANRVGFLTALLFALLGGVILNLMPCVLPVLSLKALSLVQGGASQSHAKRHAVFYTFGILAAMAALWLAVVLLQRAGHVAGWGFWLQSPLIVSALGLLMFALGLSLSGVWALPGFAPQRLAAASNEDSARGDFLTGLLAVMVATPCTGPFMGLALAYAFTAPAAMTLLVLLMLGLGLALPVLLIAFVPALAKRMPRPGAWMDTLKQLLAFPMYLTAIWMLWTLAHQRGADAVLGWGVAAIALTFALWAWPRARWGKVTAIIGLLLCGLAMAAITRLPPPATVASSSTNADSRMQPWTPRRLADLRARHKVVFVNMTADWCITCKVNEKAVFGTEAFRKSLEQHDAVYLAGDFTNEDPEIAAFLQAHGAVGVPLYVVYPRSGGAGELLQTVLTTGLVDAALARAAAK
ncbi:protein-disulfide reductase DsbD family protein [Solilutibacter silvestris]|uniref:Thiol:disulfide interchange protein n=1 Tax=Solilutibacter silvestris TaxID=1645665 RepID=A0A2K1Q281_9GAMM|nr:protein-disulfide reductase DsbD [Lysobacter silvestris]PNS09143.1 Thiol:disulfide interchange protein [Lysobacter silvestris]